MKLYNYDLDSHALNILYEKIDTQKKEIIILRERLKEYENLNYNYSFNNHSDIINGKFRSETLKIIAEVKFLTEDKFPHNPSHHVICSHKGKNSRSYGYYVSKDLFETLNNSYLEAKLIEMHRLLINSIINERDNI